MSRSADAPRRLRRNRLAARAATAAALLLLACTNERTPRLDARKTVGIDSATYAALGRFSIERLSIVCGPAAEPCPRGDLTAGAVSPRGTVAVASRTDGLLVFPPGQKRSEVVLRGTSVSGSENAGVLTADGDSGWRFLDMRSPRYLRLSSTGDVRQVDIARLTISLAGFAAADSVFVEWLVPAGDHIGDPVVSEFRAVGPPSMRGTLLARIATPAVRVASSDLRQLPPFFGRNSVWCVTPGGKIAYSPGDSLAIVIADSTGIELRLSVASPRQRVSEAEMASAVEAWMRTSGAPNARRLRQVMLADADRRRRESSAFHPSVVSIRCLGDGRIGTEGPLDIAADSVRWDLFEATGAPAGYFRVAGTDRVFAVNGDSLLLGRMVSGGENQVVWARLAGHP